LRRIVLLVSAFPKLSESFLFEKFRRLRAAGWDVWVVCRRSERRQWEGFASRADGAGLRRRVRVQWPQKPRWLAALLIPAALLRCLARRPAAAWRYLRTGSGALRRLYRDAELICLSPDLLHFEFGALAAERMNAPGLLGCRSVVSFRGYDLHASGLDQPDYYRDVWEKADALHFLGEDLWRAARLRGCPPEKPHVLIPPAVDPTFFEPDPAPAARAAEGSAQPLRVLSVGRLDWRKGYEYALEAVRLLLAAGVPVRYRIVGDGEYLEAVAFARHQMGLEETVELVGERNAAEIREEMRRADVLLHAAVSEGFSNAVLEGQAMALPVVCTDAGGLPENVSDGETGYVVARRDAPALADRLAALARDPGLRRRMGEAGRRRVMERFRVEHQISAFERLYRDVLDATSGPPALAAAEEA
jgi:colanic acid/amylovoran biosynthesis glycosyltransferase